MFKSSIFKTFVFFLALASNALAHDPNYFSPEVVVGATTIDSLEAKKLFDQGVVFVDVRKDSDWDAGRIPGAIHLEYDDKDASKRTLSLATLEPVVKPDKTVVFYCNGVHCARSSLVSKLAIEWGYKNVKYYRLGFPDWKSKGYPFE